MSDIAGGAGKPDLTDIIEAFYDAAFLPDGWQLAMNRLGAIMPSVGVAIYGYDYSSSSNLGQVGTGFDPAALESFVAHYSKVNAWAPHFARVPVGTLLNSDQVLPRRELLKSEYYHDWLRPQDDLQLGWGSLLVNDPGRMLMFSTTLRARDEETLSPFVARVVERLMPHVDRAFRLTRVLSGAELSQTMMAMMEGIADPALMLNALGRVSHANRRALDLIAAGTFTQPTRYNELRFIDPTADLALERLVRDAAGRLHRAQTNVFLARNPDGARLRCMLTPYALASAKGPLGHFTSERPVALLIMRQEGRDVRAELRARFGLTEAEVAVALSVAAGEAVQETAARRGTSVLTVRNQLRVIFDKLDVRRQGELVARVHALTAVAQDDG